MSAYLGTPLDGRSVRGRQALDELRVVLAKLGYVAYRQRSNAVSIQTYAAKNRAYPVLTQRLEDPNDASVAIVAPSLVIQAASDADSWRGNVELLGADREGDGWSYIVATAGQVSGRLRLHGWFIIPLALDGTGSRMAVRSSALVRPLTQIRALVLPLTVRFARRSG